MNSYLLEEFLFFRFRNTNSRKNSLESLFFDSILILLICVPLITRSSHRLLFNLLPLLFMCIFAFFLFLLHIFTGFLLRRFLQIVFVDFKSKHLFETLKSLLLNSVHVFLILASRITANPLSFHLRSIFFWLHDCDQLVNKRLLRTELLF